MVGKSASGGGRQRLKRTAISQMINSDPELLAVANRDKEPMHAEKSPVSFLML